MQNEIAVLPEEQTASLGTIRLATPEAVIDRAKSIATSLAQIIKDKELFNTINGKEYVRVEGWTTLGAILGVLPREVGVKKIENGYEARVELIRQSDCAVIGAASALCSRDERLWAGRDEHAVRSMAITRATSKAYRLGFSWIIQLAGYQATPAEEMTNGHADPAPINATTAQPVKQQPAKTVADATKRVEGAISEKQLARFYAIAKRAGKSGADIEDYKKSIKLDHMADLHWKKYDAACKWAEAPIASAAQQEAPPWDEMPPLPPSDDIPMDFLES